MWAVTVLSLIHIFGEAVVVTQEVDDIISSPIVKEAIINNSDCKILLDLSLIHIFSASAPFRRPKSTSSSRQAVMERRCS